jgi:TolA-binding protein
MRKNLLLSAGCCLALASTTRADIIATHTVINTGDVVRVDADGVEINLAIGQITVPKSDIVSIQVDQPATYQAGLDALKAQRFQEAVNDLKPLADRYAGLSLPWVQQSLLRLGDAYLGLKDFPSAKQEFDAFRAQYPDSPDAQGLDVKYARVMLDQKEYGKAADALQSFLGPLMKRDFLTDEQETAAAEACISLGDCQVAMNKPEDALDSYLKVVTLFNMNPDRAAEAKYKAATVFEQLGNWKRAKGSYQEVLRDSPSFAFAADAQQRLAALTKAHPE